MPVTATHTAQIIDATAASVLAAVERILAGKLVAFPTETVYGLGADATNGAAVAAIFEAKQRPAFNPLICHFPSLDDVDRMLRLSSGAMRLAEHFWPGSLSLVVPRAEGCPISRLASAGLETVAVRVPDHPVARDLLVATGRPVAAPSANRSHRLSPTRAGDVVASLGDEDILVIDGGQCRVGLESSVVAVNPGGSFELLREGGISQAEIEAVAGTPVPLVEKADLARSPGMLARHYEPRLPLRLNAESAKPGEVLLVLGPLPGDAPTGARSLSERGDLREAAANLFAMLHDAECSGASGIAISPIPNEGLGAAINDRLRRGASHGA